MHQIFYRVGNFSKKMAESRNISRMLQCDRELSVASTSGFISVGRGTELVACAECYINLTEWIFTNCGHYEKMVKSCGSHCRLDLNQKTWRCVREKKKLEE